MEKKNEEVLRSETGKLNPIPDSTVKDQHCFRTKWKISKIKQCWRAILESPVPARQLTLYLVNKEVFKHET